ncbi:MAG: threonine--tRNA ligase [Candidatus Paceibacterota bacterium]|jgi:threonyl-tRNA synthetase
MENIDTSTELSINKIRHSLAHLLAIAVKAKYPEAKLGIGPTIENGFYYDFDFGPTVPAENDLLELEKDVRALISQNIAFVREEISADQAREIFANEPYKLELVNEIALRQAQGEIVPISIYRSHDLVDLCAGPHVASTNEIARDAFHLTRIAGAYWKGSEKNKMLTRIYGIAFANKKELDDYFEMLVQAEARDHKKLGKELDLFFIDEKIGKGLPMWTPKGTAIKFELENFTRELERKYDYEHVSTPYLGSENLYKTSGHLDHYSQNMYAPIDMDGDLFYLRPMACPHHIRMYQRKAWSYKDMPVRYAEIADYNRYEKSGELMGMIRVRKFQLTDAHIFVTPEGLKDEFKRVLALIEEGMAGLGFTDIVSYRFSKRDPNNKEKYYPDDALWEKAEKTMKEALDEANFTYTEALDEAAFYGPKIDVQAKNANGKEDTLFTAQIDFLLPEKFDMEYVDSEGNKKRPVLIHRSAIGALERTFAFLIEHYAGAFPTWLAPVQVKILPISEKQMDYAKSVEQELKKNNIRVELDESNETLGKKIRNAKMQKLPYLLVLGDKEMEEKMITVETRSSSAKASEDKGEKGQKMSLADFIQKILTEIKERK